MGFLSMMGLVTAEEHAKVAKDLKDAKERNSTLSANWDREIQRAQAAESDLSVTKANLGSLRTERDGLRTKLAAAEKERDEAVRNYSEMSGICSQRDAEIVGLRAQIDAATEVINELKPLAEAMRRRRANDANRVRPSRSKKVVEVVTPESSTLVPAAKTGKATGKPRTAIPAKVGNKASAKISGDRPAQKAVRK